MIRIHLDGESKPIGNSKSLKLTNTIDGFLSFIAGPFPFRGEPSDPDGFVFLGTSDLVSVPVADRGNGQGSTVANLGRLP